MPFRGTDTSDMEQRTWFTEQEFRDEVDKVRALALTHAMLGLSLTQQAQFVQDSVRGLSI